MKLQFLGSKARFGLVGNGRAKPSQSKAPMSSAAETTTTS